MEFVSETLLINLKRRAEMNALTEMAVFLPVCIPRVLLGEIVFNRALLPNTVSSPQHLGQLCSAARPNNAILDPVWNSTLQSPVTEAGVFMSTKWTLCR